MSVWVPNDDDEVILETFHQCGMVMTPKLLAFETDINYETIRKRIRLLEEHGFVKAPDEAPGDLSSRGVYEITDLGVRYIEGDVTIAELRDDLN